MSITSPWPYFVLMVVLISVAGLFARILRQDTGKLHVPLESLRGLLATTVLLCHAVVTYFYFQTGKWSPPPSRFYSYIGSAAVTFFFFMSAFLYWSKCIARNGVGGYGAFLQARWRRLAPAYYASVAMIVLIVLARTHFTLMVPPLIFAGEVLRWLTFTPAPEMNGIKDALNINAAVTWTLFFQILFYLLLPALFRLFKGYRIFVLLGLVAGVYLVLAFRGVTVAAVMNAIADPHKMGIGSLVALFLDMFFGLGFGLGMLAAFLHVKCPPHWKVILRQRRWTPIPLLCLAAPPLLKLPAYDAGAFLFLFVVFVFVVAGNDFYGLLSSRAVFLLGTVSYSLYVTHGIALYVLSHLLNRWVSVLTLSPLQYWAFIGVAGVVEVCFAIFLYRTVELRFVARSSALAANSGVKQQMPNTVLPKSA